MSKEPKRWVVFAFGVVGMVWVGGLALRIVGDSKSAGWGFAAEIYYWGWSILVITAFVGLVIARVVIELMRRRKK